MSGKQIKRLNKLYKEIKQETEKLEAQISSCDMANKTEIKDYICDVKERLAEAYEALYVLEERLGMAGAWQDEVEEEWMCKTCEYYPPSSCDGKPCSVCDPDEPYLNCYSKRDEDA